MSYDAGGGTLGANQQPKKYIPYHLRSRELKDGSYPVRPGQPGKYSHDCVHAPGEAERHVSPPFQPGQAPRCSIEEDVQKDNVEGSGGTGTVGVPPLPSPGIDISNLLSKAVHVPDFTTIIYKCTGSLHSPDIEQPPMVQPAAVKLELEPPLDKKLLPQEQPSPNPDALSQPQQELIPDEQPLQHQPPPHGIHQQHPLQQQGDRPIQVQPLHHQQPPQQQPARSEWTPPSHLLQEPRIALQNQQQLVSNREGNGITSSQPLSPQPQWIISNVASHEQQEQQSQLNDAKGHVTDEKKQMQSVGWESMISTNAGSELMYQNGVPPSQQAIGRSEQQQMLQNPTTMTWEQHQPANRLAPQQQHPLPHHPTEPIIEQRPSSQSAPLPSVVHVRHLLVKHYGSRNPTSLKDPHGENIRRRSVDEAMETLKRLRMEAIGGGEAKFIDLAAQWSDCNSSKRGGDLGVFGRGKMQPPFEAVAFDLPVGMVSDIVLTNSGAHIIYRVA